MHHIRAAFFDIDGTLLPGDMAPMPLSTRQALLALRANGVRLFVATGRPPAMVRAMRELLQVGFDGYIAINGQCCADADGKPFYQKPLPQQAVQTLVPWLQAHPHIRCTFSELDFMYSNLPSSGFPLPVHDLTRCLTHTTYQISPHVPEELEPEILAHAPGCKFARWAAIGADLIPADGGKTVGMDKMLARFGLKREESIAFGDGLNDLEMLRHAGIGVAMGNAVDPVKQAADYVTAAVDADGIAQALAHLGIL